MNEKEIFEFAIDTINISNIDGIKYEHEQSTRYDFFGAHRTILNTSYLIWMHREKRKIESFIYQFLMPRHLFFALE